MGIVNRAAQLFGWAQRAESGDATGSLTAGAGVQPPSRSVLPTYVSPEAAITISDVYRGIQIIATSVAQLTVDEYRGRDRLERPSSIIARPQTDAIASTFFAETATDLATCGNAYWRRILGGVGSTVEVRKLDPREVVVTLDRMTDRVEYSWRGIKIPPAQMLHLKLMPRTGFPLGLGPIQAAQIELRGTIEARDYSSTWMTETDIPTGVLTTDQVLTEAQAALYKDSWTGTGEEIKGHRIRVLGQGLRYQPMLLAPKDMQFLETRAFNKTQLAALLGVPSSLLLTRVDGGAQSYQNVEQEWIGFTRFALMAYLRPMELALSELLPAGRVARFNVDGLLRSDTKTRYEAHAIALNAGFLDVDEVRGIEGLSPLTTSVVTPEPKEIAA